MIDEAYIGIKKPSGKECTVFYNTTYIIKSPLHVGSMQLRHGQMIFHIFAVDISFMTEPSQSGIIWTRYVFLQQIGISILKMPNQMIPAISMMS